jgi:kinesin family protein 3/17
MDPKNAECVKVCLRVRPISTREVQDGDDEIVTVDSSRGEIHLRNPEDPKKPLVFTFDNVFGKDATQQGIFDTVAKPIIDSLLSGFNCTIFAYGQTGTGKTYTMDGIEGKPDKAGIIPRSFGQIFAAIRNAPATTDYLVRASMYELYNEELIDSFAKGDKREKLEIHEDPKSGFYVKNLTILNIKEEKELLELLTTGKSTRKVRATAMNDYSSRSHSIFTIVVESSETDADGQTHFRIGKLNLVDLAGSEKQKQTKTSDEGLKEGININLSLTTLGNVINLLVKGSPHIPYRNSKLTKLLSDSLGGNSKTLMFANVGPARSNYAESLQAIKYASRAKMIQNKPKVNEDAKDALLRQKQEELKALKEQIELMALGDSGKGVSGVPLSKGIAPGKGGRAVPTDAQTAEAIKVQLGRFASLKNEEKERSKEKAELQRQLEAIQSKLRNQEADRQGLIQKYNDMYKDIISKHDYEVDLTQAADELKRLKSDTSDKTTYMQAQKLLKERKQEVDAIDTKSKKVQEQITALDQRLAQAREEMAFFKMNKAELGRNLTKTIEDLQQATQTNKVVLKRQNFFLAHLISGGFQRLMGTGREEGQGAVLALRPYSIHELRKPLAAEDFDIKCSYQNPYIRDINLKQRVYQYPSEASLYDDGGLTRKYGLDEFRHGGNQSPFHPGGGRKPVRVG